MKRSLCFIGLMFAAAAAHAAIQGKEVSYDANDGTKLKGYIAYDDAVKGKRPGVLVVHEWWGLNDYARACTQAGTAGLYRAGARHVRQRKNGAPS